MNISRLLRVIKKPRIIIPLILVVLFVLYQSRPTSISQDEMARAEVGVISEEVLSSGVLTAAGVSQEYAMTNGVITAIAVSNGEKVKTGAKLFTVKSTASAADRSLAQAKYLESLTNLKAAESTKRSLQTQLEAARKGILDAVNTENIQKEKVGNELPNPLTGRSFSELEKLSITSLVTGARGNFTTIEKQYNDADSAIQAAQAAVAAAKVSADATRDSTVFARIDGTVYNLRREVGDSVGVSTSDSPVLVLANAASLRIDFQVSEFNVSKIKPGQKATITFDALPGKSVNGKVSGVDTIGNEKLGSVTYGVTVRLEPSYDTLALLRPSMTANVTVVTAQKENTLIIPRAAVNLKDGAYTTVKVVSGKKVETPVTVGLIGTSYVEVREGLEEGDTILRVYSL